MRAIIGSNLITKLEPKEKQYDVRDPKLPGFVIRVNPSGKMMYVCEYTRGRRMNIGRVGVITPAQARDKALSILGDFAKGIDPRKQKIEGMTLNQFLDNEYEPWLKQHRKAAHPMLAQIRSCFKELFGDKTLTEITPALIDQWRTKRLKEGRTTETVNRNIATFKASLSKAVLWEFIDVHPLAKLKLLKVDRNGKVRYLSIDEEKKLRETLKRRDKEIKESRASGNKWRQDRGYDLYADLSKKYFADYLEPMVLLAMNTGLRRGEIFSLEWENVNLEQALLTISGAYAKSGKTRYIPLNSEVLRVLKQWKAQSSKTHFVFSNAEGKAFDNIKRSWSTLLTDADISNFRFHDLRHHFASKLVMAGVDLNTVRELLGHADISMTLRYAHLAPEHKARAVEKLVFAENIKYSAPDFLEETSYEY